MDILRGGWAPGLLGNGAGLRADSPSTGGYDTATEAIAAAFTTPPTTARKNLIDACVVSLKSAGVWTKLDALYAFAAADSQAAKINWKAPGTYNCTEVNAPSFTADQGFTGASTKYLDSNFNPTTATTPKYTQNDNSLIGWSLTAGDVLGAMIGYGDDATFLIPITAANAYFHTNCTGFLQGANADGTGLWAGSRTSSTTLELYRNGGTFTTVTAGGSLTSAALTNFKILFMVRNGTTSWGGQIAAGGFGSQLSAADNTVLYNALRTYMTGVGVP